MSLQTTEDIRLQAPFPVAFIKSLEIKQRIGEHGYLYITCVLKEHTDYEDIYSLNIHSPIRVIQEKKSKTEVLFSGVPIAVCLKSVNGILELQMTLATHTIKMDIKEKRRSFQNNHSYKEIFQTIAVEEYAGSILDYASKGGMQEGPLIQYDETDWQFLKRVASHFGAKLIADITEDYPRIAIGLPIGNSYQYQSFVYTVTKQLSKQNKDNETPCNAITYQVETPQAIQLWDKLTYNQIKFAVIRKDSRIKEGVLVHTYTLQKEREVKQPILFSEKLRGVSISGKVTAVERDRVKLHLSIDTCQPAEKAAWFSWNTPYAAEGSTGFYWMPEVGDSVTLYIPEADERNAYVKAVLRQDGKTNRKTQAPSVKRMQTAYGKEMILAPDSLQFAAQGLHTVIDMQDTEGIQIHCDRDIHIGGAEIKLSARECTFTAEEVIAVRTQNSNILIKDKVHIKSTGGVKI